MNKTYTISINPDLALLVEKEKRKGKFSNSSEFFRHLIRISYLQDAPNPEPLHARSLDARESKRSRQKEQFVPWKKLKKNLDRA